MGIICGRESTTAGRKGSRTHVRDFQPSSLAPNLKTEELDRAIAKDETTTSYQNITKVYSFKKELGHGHFGTVRLAALIANPTQKYAIKAIEKQKSKKDLHHLKRELQILKKLDHPNIIKFYETYQDDKYFYFVMEYCSGGELLDIIAQKGRLNEAEVLAIMAKAFSAVKHLHTLGIAHRDLKPENFLLASKEDVSEIKIIDFGLSRFLGDVNNMRLSTAAGTALYMAPEVLKGNYDERCDNWSLGVIMYVLLSGSPPFEGDNANAVFQRVLKGKYSMNGEKWKKVSTQAKDLIAKLLVVSPDERLTASEALEHSWFNPKSKKNSVWKPDERALSVVRNFKNTGSENTFKNEVKKMMIKYVSEAELKEPREAFRVLDVNSKGVISVEDLKKSAQEQGFKEAESEIRTMLDQGQTMINYTDFLIAVIDEKTLYTKERLQMVFKQFDLHNMNEITVVGIKEVMARGGKRVSDDEVQKMLKGAGLAQTKKITFEEFKTALGAQ